MGPSVNECPGSRTQQTRYRAAIDTTCGPVDAHRGVPSKSLQPDAQHVMQPWGDGILASTLVGYVDGLSHGAHWVAIHV